MNLYQLIYFLIPFTGASILLYIMYTGVLNYKSSRNKNTLYLIASFALLALMMYIYSLTPFLNEDQPFFAEITLGGGFIISMLVIPIYIEYFHGIYRKIPFISTIFYVAVGGGFVTLFFQPWEIQYANDIHGFSQSFSDLLLICLFIQLACVFFTMTQAFRVIKTRVDNELRNVDRILKEVTDNQEQLSLMRIRKDSLRSKIRILNYIVISFFLGICMVSIGLLIPMSFIDSFGILVIAAPQAYFYSRDREILLYLSSQKVREDTLNLKKGIDTLRHQSRTLPANLEIEIQSMVEFIEKADLILPHRNK